MNKHSTAQHSTAQHSTAQHSTAQPHSLKKSPDTTQVQSRERVRDHGEVFTHEREVNAMLDLVKSETLRIDSRFLEPACGTGNFLVEILRRKLAVVATRYKKQQSDYERYAFIAAASIYGIDILADNVAACRARLFALFQTQYHALYRQKCQASVEDALRYVLSKNILHGDALTLKTIAADNDTNAPAAPIVFCEWVDIAHQGIVRRDYVFDDLVKFSTPPPPDDLFSPQNLQNTNASLLPESDQGTQHYQVHALKEFAPTHYLKLSALDGRCA